jgi:hypothetical protein
VKEQFLEKKLNRESLFIIEKANAIINEYQLQGYSLSLRQLYYQFVSRDLIPNNVNSYKRLGNIISDGRLIGMIDWDAISDRTRKINSTSIWDDPQEIFNAAVNSYNIDKWYGQSCYIEIWVEKDALIDIVKGVADKYEITSFACKGYVSQSSMYEASRRFIDNINKECILFHLGDHDPSGIDMTRDIDDRLNMFGANLQIKRIALNMDQIDQYNPPPNPAKMTDSRFKSYISEYGNKSWELDALDPESLSGIIFNNIYPYIDFDYFQERKEKQENDKKKMKRFVNTFEL